MLIGIVSDSHDNLLAIQEAVNIFNEKDVDIVLHAGDYISPFAVEEFEDLNCEMKGVFGNNDGEVEGVKEAVKEFGDIEEEPRTLELDGEKVLLSHKPPEEVPPEIKLVVHGHTHEPRIEKENGKIVVNPGESSGWLSGNRTIAMVDTDKGDAEIIEF